MSLILINKMIAEKTLIPTPENTVGYQLIKKQTYPDGRFLFLRAGRVTLLDWKDPEKTFLKSYSVMEYGLQAIVPSPLGYGHVWSKIVAKILGRKVGNRKEFLIYLRNFSTNKYQYSQIVSFPL